MKRRGWFLYICGGVLVTAAFLFVPGFRQGWLFNVIAISSPIVIVIAVRVWTPQTRLPWYLFALGQAFFVAGDVITYNYDRFFGTELPFPSVGDVFYLSVYPCLILGILWLIRLRTPGGDRDSVIDSLIVAIGVGTISWVFLLSPLAHDPQVTLLQKLTAMGYPVMDLILLTVVVRLAIGGGRRAPAFYLMAGATLALFVTDFAYSYLSVQGIVYDQSGYLEAGWASFYILWGAAALHGSMRALSERTPDNEPRLSRGRLWLLALASLLAPSVMMIQYLRGVAGDLPVLIGASAALFLLVVVRIAGLVRKQEQSAVRERALRGAGTALVTATNREGIYAATLQAARSIAGESSVIRVLVGEDSEDYTVVAAAGGREDVVGVSLDLSILPQWKRDRLNTHRSYEVTVADAELAEPLGFPPESAFLLSGPLFMKDELRGLLVVGGSSALPRANRDTLEALTSQVALALDSAALTEDLLRQQTEARFRSLVQNSTDVVMVVDTDSTVRYVSPSVEGVFGYDASELENTKLTRLIHPDDKTQVLQFLTLSGREGATSTGLIESRMRHRDDFWLHIETLRTDLMHDPNVKGIVLNSRDVSERKAFEEQLSHQAFHDSITGLANRALFRDRVEHALERLTRNADPVSVLFMDLDDFKTINDSLGHAAGDRLLGEVGERLRTCLRTPDTAARLGGDEFAILIEDGGESVGAAAVAGRILEALDGPFLLDGKEVFVRASIGIATSGVGRTTGPEGAEELLRNADVAMYIAKEAGKNRFQIFEPEMHDTALRRLELKADLQRAVENEEFVLYYQPVIRLESGDIEGFEALVRWNHPTRGLVMPLDFIPLAEETGLVVQIGTWVLREACRQGDLLQRIVPEAAPLHMAVNLSARQLQRPEIVQEIARVLLEAGLPPECLVLEITESVMMQDMALSNERLTQLKQLGVLLAVDDFGTGYSSLNYIRRFPVDILKVDKSFVDGVSDGGEESALTAAIIELAGILNLRPVAEGIERADQLDKLLELHCELGQGYYFSKPLPIEGVVELLRARHMLAARDAELTS
ncbi:MAG TPA: EAL domain-containing protein [Actinomycetota bacterium]|nr:EAL domain-containing protein [Actinomycetota bacterium]